MKVKSLDKVSFKNVTSEMNASVSQRISPFDSMSSFKFWEVTLQEMGGA